MSETETETPAEPEEPADEPTEDAPLEEPPLPEAADE